MEKNSPLNFLNSTPARVVTGLLLIQTVMLYAFNRPEVLPPSAPLSTFPALVADWKLVQEGYVDAETQEVLKADDTLTRTYARPDDRAATNLFIAAFRSQRTGKAPHSPKNCLPGAGWVQSSNDTLSIDVPGQKIDVNRYIVSKGDARSVVIYWYQSHNRIVASEYKAKIYVVVDSLRNNRTDTALVRVVAPVINKDDDAATRTAIEFVQAMFPAVKAALPN